MVGALLPLIKVQYILPEQNFLQAKLKLIGGLANDEGCIPDMLQNCSQIFPLSSILINLFRFSLSAVVLKESRCFCALDDEPVSNTILHLYGENALFALIELSKRQNWQIYDTGIGEMLDLENPAKNGYENFQTYLKQILTRKG